MQEGEMGSPGSEVGPDTYDGSPSQHPDHIMEGIRSSGEESYARDYSRTKFSFSTDRLGASTSQDVKRFEKDKAFEQEAYPITQRQKIYVKNSPTSRNKTVYHSSLFRYRGTVIPRLLLPLLFVGVWTTFWTVILLIDRVNFLEGIIPRTDTGHLMNVLSIVMPLLVGYKNNISYARYWEGRCVWAELEKLAISSTVSIWYTVQSPTQKDLDCKRCAINLIIAFVSSTRHYMRNELGIYYNDICPYLSHLPKGFDNETISVRRIPLEIMIYLQSYLENLLASDQIDSHDKLFVEHDLAHMIECFTSFERIRSTPVPFAYSLHIRQALYIYLLSLPFQIYSICRWVTIPIVLLACFVLVGVDLIGVEIQNPFGYESNKLFLDEYFNNLKLKLLSIMNSPSPSGPETWSKPYT